MLQGEAVKCLIVFMIIIKCVYNFEIILSKTNDNQDQNIERLVSFRNKSYEIPLFQTRYITIQTHLNDFLRNNINVVGFKFQIRSTRPELVNIQKQIMISTKDVKSDDLSTVLLEDLYILPRKNALRHIFNVYPSPKLIRPTQKSINGSELNITWSMDGVRMGITDLTFRLDVFYDNDTSFSHNWSLNILVTQPKRRIDTIFYILIPFIVISISILMGVLLNTDLIIEIFKKPKPLIVGFVAQYGLMPFLAMAIAKIFRYTPLNSLSLFVIGCCPGSGASNQWTVVFDGDVNLSAVMSFVSTTASFIMMPIYFYTIGKLYMDDLSITIPFLGLARSLALVVIPYSIGIGISHFFPKSRPFVGKLIKPMMIFLMLFFMTFGFMVNWYLFMMIDLYTILTAPLLPFIGFFLGGVLAWISRISWKQIKTVGIEAGIQNTGIAFMIIIYSFPQPYATEALIVPLVVAFLTTKPFWVILIIRNQVNKYKKQKALKKQKQLEKELNSDGKLIISNDKPALNNEDINNTKNHAAENMQQL